jgi:two-component system chemotaxis sensor kinase CheA
MHVRTATLTLKEKAAPVAAAPAAASAAAAPAAPAASDPSPRPAAAAPAKAAANKPVKQNLINVSLSKLDELMDLMGELVITNSMVIHSPDLK